MRNILIGLILTTTISAQAASVSTTMQARITIVDTCQSTSSSSKVTVRCFGGSQVNISTQPISSSETIGGTLTIITY